jgi:DNA processing protein
MNDENKVLKILLQLFLSDGISAAVISKLTRNYTIDKDLLLNFLQYKISDFIALGFSNNLSESIFKALKNEDKVLKELACIQKLNTEILTPFDKRYPFLLNQLEERPAILYVQKRTSVTIDWNIYLALSVVSSRKTNFYGKRVIDNLISSLKGTKTIIVSGGAIGGDAMVHKAALNNGLKTIAIIGSGLTNRYPKINEKLFDEIIDNDGFIVSPFKTDFIATTWSFPVRNAIIAGISKAILVIQGNKESGTLITAQRALDFNKEVGSVPGQFDDPLSGGPHYLLKEGANLISSSEDLFEMLGLKKDLYINEEKELNLKDKIIIICKEPINISGISNILSVSEKEIEEKLFELLTENRIKTDILGRFYSI